jgi:hypothetical protein
VTDRGAPPREDDHELRGQLFHKLKKLGLTKLALKITS